MNALDRYLSALGQGMDIIAAAQGLSERDLVERGASDVAARDLVQLCDIYFGRSAFSAKQRTARSTTHPLDVLSLIEKFALRARTQRDAWAVRSELCEFRGSATALRKRARPPPRGVAGGRWLAAGVESEQALNRSLMIDVSTRVLFPSMMALSFYFFFAGHNAPGGGFAGGLVAALALILRYLAGGRAELDEALPIDAGRTMGAGLSFSALAVVVPMFFGHPPLTSGYTSPEIPLIGAVSLPSALVFDLGVYLIVVGLTLYVLSSLGAKLDEEEEMRKQRARDRARSLARKNRERSTKQKAQRAQKQEKKKEKIPAATSSSGTGSEDNAGKEK